MISCYLGKPGAGKSYAAVVAALSVVRAGGSVVTNLPILEEPFYARARGLPSNSTLSARLIARSGRTPPPVSTKEIGQLTFADDSAFASPAFWQTCLRLSSTCAAHTQGTGLTVILDEAASWARAVASLSPSARDDLLSCLERHRHSYLSVILLAQTHVQLDPVKSVKRYVSLWSEIHNLRETAKLPAYTRSVYDTWYGERTALDIRRGTYRSDVFEIYKSHGYAAVTAEDSALELGVERGHSDARSPLFRLLLWPFVLIFVVLALGFAVTRVDLVSLLTAWLGFGPPSTSEFSSPAADPAAPRFALIDNVDDAGRPIVGGCVLSLPAGCASSPSPDRPGYHVLACTPEGAAALDSAAALCPGLLTEGSPSRAKSFLPSR